MACEPMPPPPPPPTTAVDLVRVREVLQRYVRALSGAGILVLDGPESSSCLAGMVDEAGEALMRLPPQSSFATYKRAAAHQSGHLEAGTRAFEGDRPSVFPEDLRAVLPGLPRPESGVAGLAGFLGAFPDAGLAWRLFDLLEDCRVDALLRARYRGLRRLLAPAGPGPDLTALPLRRMLLAALARLAAGDPLLLAVPETAASLAARGAALVNLLASPGATVEDALEATIRLYLVVRAVPNAPAAVWRRLDPVVVDLGRARIDPAEPADLWLSLWARAHSGLLDPTFTDNEREGDASGAASDEWDNETPPSNAGLPAPRRPRERAAAPGAGTDPSTPGPPLGDEEARAEGSAPGPGEPRPVEVGATVPEAATPGADDRVPGAAMDRLLCEGEAVPFTYPEWDHRAGAYRAGWCTVWERRLKPGDGGFFEQALRDYRYLVRQVERRFELLRPDLLRLQRGLDDGEEFDLDRVIEARIERRVVGHLHDRVYQRRARLQRSVSLLVLLDMSLSTSEGVLKLDPRKDDLGWTAFERPAYKRIVDVEKESLVVLSRALEQVGDRYGIYGFSGRGRHGTRFYVVKGMGEPLAGAVGRIGTIAPVQATRMGPAVRHATAILGREPSRTKILVIIGDGQPQDVDYGTGDDGAAHARLSPSEQRRVEREYALADTHRALTEARGAGVDPFILSIDRHGQDYLRAICGGFGYAVVQEVAALPRRLVALYDLLAT